MTCVYTYVFTCDFEISSKVNLFVWFGVVFCFTFLFFNALMATQTFVLMQHLSLHIDIQ